MTVKLITAAAALVAFRGQDIKVQTATPKKAKGEDGKPRDVFETKMEPLRAELILAAKQHDDGRVTITTIDGRRYEGKAKLEAEEPKGKDK